MRPLRGLQETRVATREESERGEEEEEKEERREGGSAREGRAEPRDNFSTRE